jgi:probable HAF family extracellular repeat protein
VGGSPVTCAATECRNAGTCAPATGECGGSPKANGATCSDNNLCTTTDTCQSGECVGTGALACDDGDPCTIDSCNARTGCAHEPAPAGTTCDDGDACTTASQCQAGLCVATAALDCSDDDPCTSERCDATVGCVRGDEPNGTACDDGSLCTQVDWCQGGACVGAMPVVCRALDQCHVAGTCDPDSGACSNPIAPANTACSDGSVCTTDDRCVAGACVGAALGCDDGDPCTLDGCDAKVGCVNSVAPDNTPCGDNDPCTTTTACIDGGCVATAYLVCDDGNPCTTDACEARVGCVTQPVEDGVSCADDDLCTTGERCVAGACRGQVAGCEDKGECFEAEGCNAVTGACEYAELPGDIPVPIGLTALGTLGGATSEAAAIDGSGRVVGQSDVAGGRRHAFMWQDGALVDLTPAATDARAHAIEDGVVAGVLEDGTGRAAFRWKDGVLERLWTVTGELAAAHLVGPVGGAVAGTGTSAGSAAGFFAAAGSAAVVIEPPAGTRDVEVLAINTRGEVVGRFTAADGSRHAFLWSRGDGLADLGSAGVTSVAHDIDAQGRIVGARGGEAFIRSAAGVVTGLGQLCDEATPPRCGQDSEALFINDAGVVLGRATTPDGAVHAFLWTNAGGMVDLATLGGDVATPMALSPVGLALGESATAWGASHVVLWTSTGERLSLGSFAAASSSAIGLNGLGQVAGNLDVAGKRRAFFWSEARGLVELGTFGGAEAHATALGDDGRVVGWALDAGGRTRAFISDAPRTACVVCDDDRRPPEIACPVVFRPVACVAGGAAVYLGEPTVFDACGQAIEVSSDALELYPVGVTQVAFEAIDAAGNLASCTTTVLVEDEAPPILDCPDKVTVTAVDGLCGATAEWTVGAEDACDASDAIEITTPDAGWLYPVGSSVAEVAATDSAGNRATCQTVVEVIDPLPFAISCPDAIELTAPADQCRYPEAVEATVQARCRDALKLRTNADGFPIGTSTIGFTAVDNEGETASCETRLVVRDVTAPIVGCGALPARLESGQQPAVFVATASDACGATPVVSDVGCVDASGAAVACDVRAEGAALVVGKLATGEYSVRWNVTATDPSGNSETVACEVLARGLGDRDQDTIIDDVDNCPDDKNTDQADTDSDGVGNVCDDGFTGLTASGDGGCAGASGGLLAGLAGLCWMLARVRRRDAR